MWGNIKFKFVVHNRNCKRNWKFHEVFASKAASSVCDFWWRVAAEINITFRTSNSALFSAQHSLSALLPVLLLPMRNSLVISILSIHWLPKMMAQKKSLEIPTKVRQIECSRNAFGTSWKLFYDFHSVFAIDIFFPAANDSWWISFRWRATLWDGTGGGRSECFICDACFGRKFSLNRNKILSISSPLFPI